MPNEGYERVMESFDFQGVPNPVANPAKQPNELAIFSQVTDAIKSHSGQAGKGFHIPSGGITNEEVGNNAGIAESKLSFSIPPWIAVNYAANWTTPTGNDAVSYRKYATKMVQLSGVATKVLGLINNDLICTLPVNHRPDRLARFVIYGLSATNTLVPAFLTISISGEMRLQLGSTNPSQYITIPNNCLFYAP